MELSSKRQSNSATRREFLAAIVASAGAATAAETDIQTVTGALPVSKLGITLIHEHVMVDFVGADQVSKSRYNAEEVFRAALPKLQQVAKAGCKTLVECTPAYLGRDPLLLQRLSKASGVTLLTNTGYYGAAKDKYVPKLAYEESVTQIADRWIKEAASGIDGTAIKPAFMKIGVDSGELSEIDAKLIGAAVVCHKATGLRMHVHTGDGVAAKAIARMLDKLKITPAAYVWVHAQSEKNRSTHVELANEGCWVELDGINPKSAAAHLDAIENLANHGHLSRVLVSQDSGWYHVGEPRGGQFNGYSYLLTDFVPALKARGFREDQIRLLLVENPAKALTPER